MKLSKKLISLLLAISVCISCISVAAAEKPTETDLDLSIAYGLLEELSVVKSDDICQSAAVTRKEFASLFASATKVDTATAELYLSQNRYMKADECITYGAACEMIVNFLGYGEIVLSQKGNVSANYFKKAKNLKLMSTSDGDKKISGSDTVKIIYNMLIIECAEPTSYGDKYEYGTGKTILEQFYGIEIIEDVVSANEYASVFRDVTSGGKNTIVVGNTSYNYYGGNGEELLGREVKAFVCTDSKTARYIHTTGNDECVTLESKDISHIGKDYIKYTVGDSEKEYKLTLEDAMIVFNGESDFSLATCDIIEKLKNNDCKITLIKRETKNFDTVIAKAYTDAKVKNLSTDEKNVYVESLSGTVELPLEEDGNDLYIKIISDGGETLTKAALTKGTIVSYALSESSNVCEIVVCTKTVAGKISVVYDTPEKKVEIDGKKYDTAATLLGGRAVKAGDEGTYHLNIFGKIVSVDNLKSEYNLGYVWGATEPETEDDDICLKIYTTDKETKAIKCASKVKLDGVGGRTSVQVAEKIAPGGTLKPQLIRYKLNADGEINFIDTAATSEATRESDDSLYIAGSRMKRKFESDWDTKAFTFSSASGETYKAGYPVSYETEFFVLSSDTSKINEDDFAYYSTLVSTIFTAAQSTDVEIYKCDGDTAFSEIVLWYATDDFKWKFTTYPSMVNSVTTVYDAEEDETYAAVNTLTLQQTGQTFQYLAADTVKVTKVDGSEAEVPGLNISSYVGEGDILQVGVNSAGYMTSLAIIFDYSEEQTYWGWQNANGTGKDSYEYRFNTVDWASNINTSMQFYGTYGYITDKWMYGDNSIFGNNSTSSLRSILAVADMTNLSGENPGSYTEIYAPPSSMAYFRCPIFDPTRKTNKAYYGIVSDITDYNSTSGREYDKMFTYWGQAKSSMLGFAIYK